MKCYIYRRPDGMEIQRPKKEDIPGYELIAVVDFKAGHMKGYKKDSWPCQKTEGQS